MARAPLIALALTTAILLCACTRNESAPVSSPVSIAEPEAIATEPQIDPATGLIMAQDWELVRANCMPCHSLQLVTQQRGTAQQWLAMIRWMQAKQNLWQFDENTEKRIVGYLATNYAPDAAQRRAAIPPDLMPPNPYSSTE
ncbi:MAG: hypothetical protein QNJ14_09030 [Woeseiaceae bacterium]|nr:hypothetical protein [Woeseiaceae bacterium]